jgi:hypothetical protein
MRALFKSYNIQICPLATGLRGGAHPGRISANDD